MRLLILPAEIFHSLHTSGFASKLNQKSTVMTSIRVLSAYGGSHAEDVAPH
jgi:hypothetical protein